jgi:hypothetical protein
MGRFEKSFFRISFEKKFSGKRRGLQFEMYIHLGSASYIYNLSADIYNATPYIINVRDDIKDAASSEADYKSASYIFNVRGWEAVHL